jgi:hypothetical protein
MSYQILVASKRVPPGLLNPGEWHFITVVVVILGYFTVFVSLHYIVMASLHRYHRLCGVQKGTLHEKLFQSSKYATTVATVCVFLSNSVNIFVYRHVALSVLVTLSLAWLVLLDFYLNFSVRRSAKLMHAR